MAESSSSESSDYITASASQIQTVRSSSGTPAQVYRKWLSASASRASEKDQNRIKLFETLEKYIRASGGFVVSPPGDRVLRIEIPRGSDLPVRLAAYRPVLCGSSMRTTNAGFVNVDIVEIVLEGANAIKITI
jgi:hypothetical protein